MNTPAETGDAAGSQETAEGAAPPGAGGRPGPAAPARPRRAALDLGLLAPRSSVCCVSCTVRGASLRRPCLAWAGGPPTPGGHPVPGPAGPSRLAPRPGGVSASPAPFLNNVSPQLLLSPSAVSPHPPTLQATEVATTRSWNRKGQNVAVHTCQEPTAGPSWGLWGPARYPPASAVTHLVPGLRQVGRSCLGQRVTPE